MSKKLQLSVKGLPFFLDNIVILVIIKMVLKQKLLSDRLWGGLSP